jgi:UDP-N-acetylmuramoyl-tripeptide--D-alanyl-D-alanine ligase
MSVEELYRIYTAHPSVQTDTRKLKPGDIFFALKGENFNGNEFAADAIAKGAAYAVIDSAVSEIAGKTILVDNVLDTLQQLALHHRKQFNIPFIAITGSNGKTTTKELVHAVLSSGFKTYTTEGNLNNQIGVPLTILKIKTDAEMAVIEMGANHLYEIASYCSITLPTHGLITNCGKAHLEGFGSEEAIKKAKGELFDYLRSNQGTAFVMWDYDYLRKMSKGIAMIIKYGTADADVEGKVLANDPFLEVTITKGMNADDIKTRLVGDYNFPNVLAAVCVGAYFGLTSEKIKTAIRDYIPSNSRSQLLEKGTNRIILDAYNANPSSMKLAIENFARMQAANKVLMLGAMAELGSDSMDEHKIIVDLIRQYKWKQVVLTGGDFLKIEHPYLAFETSELAAEWFRQQQFSNTYLLIKGSRSTQMEKVLE